MLLISMFFSKKWVEENKFGILDTNNKDKPMIFIECWKVKLQKKINYKNITKLAEYTHGLTLSYRSIYTTLKILFTGILECKL